MEKVKVVLLTGGSSGIGAATAHLLAQAGFTVYAGSRRGTIDRPQDGIIPIQLDVNDEAMAREAVAQILEKEGRLDAVVCNAGNGIYGPVEGTLDQEARSQFETTFFGSLKTVQACLPVFRKQGFGRIVTVASVMSILPLPYQVFYSCAKAALLSLTEGLAMELSGTGIQCCCILPGDVATGFTQARKLNQAALEADSPYKENMARNLAKIEKDEQGGMAPEVIGNSILKQLKKKKMRPRVIPRIDDGMVGFIVRICPVKWRLKLVNLLYN